MFSYNTLRKMIENFARLDERADHNKTLQLLIQFKITELNHILFYIIMLMLIVKELYR